MLIKTYTEELSVCKVQNISQVDFSDKFCFLGKTDEEISLVCLTNKVPENVTQRDDGWKMFRIEGELDFSLIGILSEISAILAEMRSEFSPYRLIIQIIF
ncbi:hypothetical protein GCM10023142_12030 [Anaerocolumna aminovalerica]|uniref:Uncharacterized protein n=1 Tax=Anaerocolumna aminovalerica TaxID=1527 RepID=A0A1I5FVI3_9FIRM|nr:hypothetical protein [Anaerocolumna aminovalerica]SFO27818.1 hypothetical protein SAMN04489757_11615 [Anaerocolumna aminovalerica]